MINSLIRLLWLSGAWLGVCLMSYGQTVSASLLFSQDSLYPGAPVDLRMLIIHPADVEVFPPNNTRDFLPFEMLSFQVAPTEIVNADARDAIVYRLRSFEVNPQQSLTLKYSYLKGTDTVTASVNSDTIFFASRVQGNLDSMDYQVFEDIIPLTDPPNYRPLIIAVLAICVLAILLYLALRKRIQRYLELRSLQSEWQQIRKKLRKLDQLENTTIFFSAINTLWKSYVDPREELSLRSLTTTELRAVITQLSYLSAEQQRDLIRIAETADEVIYAGNTEVRFSSEEAIQRIRVVLRKAYEERRKALHHVR